MMIGPERRSFAIRTVYAVCLSGASCNHIAILLDHGLLWDYGGVSRVSAAFWTMLTVVDPAVAVLLYLRPNAGVGATASLILADVTHNLLIKQRYATPGDFLAAVRGDPFMLCQILFLVFVLATAHHAWTRGNQSVPDAETM